MLHFRGERRWQGTLPCLERAFSLFPRTNYFSCMGNAGSQSQYQLMPQNVFLPDEPGDLRLPFFDHLRAGWGITGDATAYRIALARVLRMDIGPVTAFVDGDGIRRFWKEGHQVRGASYCSARRVCPGLNIHRAEGSPKKCGSVLLSLFGRRIDVGVLLHLRVSLYFLRCSEAPTRTDACGAATNPMHRPATAEKVTETVERGAV